MTAYTTDFGHGHLLNHCQHLPNWLPIILNCTDNKQQIILRQLIYEYWQQKVKMKANT